MNVLRAPPLLIESGGLIELRRICANQAYFNSTLLEKSGCLLTDCEKYQYSKERRNAYDCKNNPNEDTVVNICGKQDNKN